jgi:hypothetical protein
MAVQARVYSARVRYWFWHAARWFRGRSHVRKVTRRAASAKPWRNSQAPGKAERTRGNQPLAVATVLRVQPCRRRATTAARGRIRRRLDRPQVQEAELQVAAWLRVPRPLALVRPEVAPSRVLVAARALQRAADRRAQLAAADAQALQRVAARPAAQVLADARVRRARRAGAERVTPTHVPTLAQGSRGHVASRTACAAAGCCSGATERWPKRS